MRRGEGDEGREGCFNWFLEWGAELRVQEKEKDPTKLNKEIKIKTERERERSWVLDEDEACSLLPNQYFLPQFLSTILYSLLYQFIIHAKQIILVY